MPMPCSHLLNRAFPRATPTSGSAAARGPTTAQQLTNNCPATAQQLPNNCLTTAHQGLLTRDPDKRLGCGEGPAGSDAIKRHPFFKVGENKQHAVKGGTL
jgi:hypothetical protein